MKKTIAWLRYLGFLLAIYGGMWLAFGLLAVVAITAYAQPVAAVGFALGCSTTLWATFRLRLLRKDAKSEIRDRGMRFRRFYFGMLTPPFKNAS